jgi:hypothetical protein
LSFQEKNFYRQGAKLNLDSNPGEKSFFCLSWRLGVLCRILHWNNVKKVMRYDPDLNKGSLLLIGMAVALIFAVWGCVRQEEVPADPESVFTIKGNVIGLDLRSPMLKYLEISPIPPSAQQTQDLKEVGQIIALANDSDQLVGSRISWVELDPDYSKSLGLRFDSHTAAHVGDAYGVVTLPDEYLGQLKPWERVEISRYGLLASRTTAAVVSIQQAKLNGVPILGKPLEVVFKIPNGQDWYPGTNCVVDFPMLGSKPFLVPATALLHEGRQEYLLEEITKGQYSPVPIYILDTVGDSVMVIGKIRPKENIISRGSILLKPMVHRLLRAQGFGMDLGDREEKQP